MKPILFAAGETTFTTNGLGRLSDAITCTVEEERNGKYELTMEYPIDGIHFSEIAHSCIIMATPADGKDPQPFRVYGISKPINGKVTIHAEHISYQLLHIPVSPFSDGGNGASCAAALNYLKTNSAETNPFTMWTDKTNTVNTYSVDTPMPFRELLGGTQGSILDYFGGEYEWDGYTVKLWQNRGTDNGVTLRYGKNITDLTQEEAIDATYTGIYPYWKGMSANGAETTVTLTEKVLHSTNAQYFPYQRTIPVDFSQDFSTQPTEAQLRTRGNAYMTANGIGVPKVSIKIKFLPLWQSEEYKNIANLERVNLCDTVHVVFQKLGVTATAKVVKTKYNVLAERYDEVELGDAKSSMVKAIRSDISDAKNANTKQLSFLQQAIAEATQRITGATDGYIKQVFNANGEWSELLAMNTNDPATATKVWRMNYEGIGGGSGVNGPFTITMTLDGKINASQINTGTLNANLIKAGTLASVDGNNFSLDLATGTLVMKKGSINIGNGAFAVDTAGNMTMTKGSINIGSGAFVVSTAGNMTMTKGSIDINNSAFKVTSQGVMSCKGAKIQGTVTTGDISSGPWMYMNSGFLTAGNAGTTYGTLRTRTISSNNGLGVEASVFALDVSHIYVDNGNNAFAEGFTGTIWVPANVVNGEPTAWLTKQFHKGLMVK